MPSLHRRHRLMVAFPPALPRARALWPRWAPKAAQGLPLQNRVGGVRSLAAPELAARSLTSWRGVAQVLCLVARLTSLPSAREGGRAGGARLVQPRLVAAKRTFRDVRLAVGGGGFD